MKFNTADLVTALQLDSLGKNDVVALVVTGELTDGRAFVGSDCVRLLGNANRTNRPRASR